MPLGEARAIVSTTQLSGQLPGGGAARGFARATRRELRVVGRPASFSQIPQSSFDLVVKRTQALAQFVYTVTIAAGRRIERNTERIRDLLELHAFPEPQVNGGALVRRQFAQGFVEGAAKGLL